MGCGSIDSVGKPQQILQRTQKQQTKNKNNLSLNSKQISLTIHPENGQKSIKSPPILTNNSISQKNIFDSIKEQEIMLESQVSNVHVNGNGSGNRNGNGNGNVAEVQMLESQCRKFQVGGDESRVGVSERKNPMEYSYNKISEEVEAALAKNPKQNPQITPPSPPNSDILQTKILRRGSINIIPSYYPHYQQSDININISANNSASSGAHGGQQTGANLGVGNVRVIKPTTSEMIERGMSQEVNNSNLRSTIIRPKSISKNSYEILQTQGYEEEELMINNSSNISQLNLKEKNRDRNQRLR